MAPQPPAPGVSPGRICRELLCAEQGAGLAKVFYSLPVPVASWGQPGLAAAVHGTGQRASCTRPRVPASAGHVWPGAGGAAPASCTAPCSDPSPWGHPRFPEPNRAGWVPGGMAERHQVLPKATLTSEGWAAGCPAAQVPACSGVMQRAPAPSSSGCEVLKGTNPRHQLPVFLLQRIRLPRSP